MRLEFMTHSCTSSHPALKRNPPKSIHLLSTLTWEWTTWVPPAAPQRLPAKATPPRHLRFINEGSFTKGDQLAPACREPTEFNSERSSHRFCLFCRNILARRGGFHRLCHGARSTGAPQLLWQHLGFLMKVYSVVAGRNRTCRLGTWEVLGLPGACRLTCNDSDGQTPFPASDHRLSRISSILFCVWSTCSKCSLCSLIHPQSHFQPRHYDNKPRCVQVLTCYRIPAGFFFFLTLICPENVEWNPTKSFPSCSS